MSLLPAMPLQELWRFLACSDHLFSGGVYGGGYRHRPLASSGDLRMQAALFNLLTGLIEAASMKRCSRRTSGVIQPAVYFSSFSNERLPIVLRVRQETTLSQKGTQRCIYLYMCRSLHFYIVIHLITLEYSDITVFLYFCISIRVVTD